MDMDEENMAMDEKASFDRFAKFHQKKYETKEEYGKRFNTWYRAVFHPSSGIRLLSLAS